MENISDQNLIQNDTWYNGYVEFSLPPAARFWLLIVFEIPSLVCSVILLYYLIMDANSRKLLSNHVIIALLSIGLLSQLIDIPSYLNFIRLNYVWPQTPLSCILWWFGATGISNITNLMMAWISIERHILIFNDRWLLTKRKQFFIHYIPLLTIISYGFIFYIIILTIYPCENMYTYTEDWCLYPCYYNDNKLALYDTIVNSIIPIPIIIIFNLLLIIRVIKQKHNLHRRIQWRQCRRMIKQLLSISALFLFI